MAHRCPKSLGVAACRGLCGKADVTLVLSDPSGDSLQSSTRTTRKECSVHTRPCVCACVCVFCDPPFLPACRLTVVGGQRQETHSPWLHVHGLFPWCSTAVRRCPSAASQPFPLCLFPFVSRLSTISTSSLRLPLHACTHARTPRIAGSSRCCLLSLLLLLFLCCCCCFACRW